MVKRRDNEWRNCCSEQTKIYLLKFDGKCVKGLKENYHCFSALNKFPKNFLLFCCDTVVTEAHK